MYSTIYWREGFQPGLHLEKKHKFFSPKKSFTRFCITDVVLQLLSQRNSHFLFTLMHIHSSAWKGKYYKLCLPFTGEDLPPGTAGLLHSAHRQQVRLLLPISPLNGFLHYSSFMHTSVNPWSLVSWASKWSSSGALLTKKKKKQLRYKKHNWEIIEKDCKEVLLVLSWCSFITKQHHWGLHSVFVGIRLLITNQAGSQLLVKGACWAPIKISHL